jgi:hypothetical protein
MNENELSEQLHTVAATVNPQPDLAEIELGAGRVRSRRRVATGVVAAMLVAGAGGAGFGIGRSVADDGDQIAAGATADDAADDPTTATTVSESPEDDSGPPAAPPTTVLNDRGTSPPIGTADEPAAYDVAAAEAGGYYTPEPMTLVYERVLDNGVRIRLQQGQSWGGEEWYGSDWQPAAFCWATAEGRLTIDGSDVVDVAGYGWYEELFKGLAVQAFEAGHADGHVMRLLQIQAAPDVTEVAVTWPDGATDRTAPSNGAAVLVVEDSGAYDGYTLKVTGASGTTTLTDRDLDYYDDPDYRAACEEPPPALPEAGEQPADPAAAEAALLERFQLLWDRTREDWPGELVDDDTGIEAALAQIIEGPFAESAETATHIVEELVFTSPTEAWFRYAIDSETGFFGQRYGYATLTDGGWVFPRALVCQDLGLAGGSCEPWVEAIYPPSWYERHGDPYTECWIDESGEEVCEYYSSDGPLPPPTTVVIEG